MMNKETLELRKAIRDGVAEGIKKGLESVPVYEAELLETKPDLKAYARELRDYCGTFADGCGGCTFYDKLNDRCKIDGPVPTSWEI